MKEISGKKWVVCSVGILFLLIIFMALLTYIIDPYFHYHEPFSWVRYRLYEQRYINDGISRHFEYDAVITGNSLSENTKTSEFDELFACKSIKLPYSGAGFKELWGNLDRTLSYNPSVRQVLVIMDYDDIARDKDYTRYTEYPDYLYDDSIWNDGSYLWNKNVLYHGTLYNVLMTAADIPSTTFDEYSAWESQTGADVVLPKIGHIRQPEEISVLEYGEEQERMVADNLNANIIPVIKKYPQIRFYLVYSPPSIAKWCGYYNNGEIPCRIESGKTAAEILLQEENVQLYSFLDEFDMVCDLDNYRDTIHFKSEINSYFLECIANGRKRLTSENYGEHMDLIKKFYTEYDYLSLNAKLNVK